MLLRAKGDPVLYLTNPPGISKEPEHGDVDSIRAPTRQRDALAGDPEITTRIAQYEMVLKVQASVPDLMDIGGEGAKMIELFGCQPGDESFASNCLLGWFEGTRGILLTHFDSTRFLCSPSRTCW